MKRFAAAKGAYHGFVGWILNGSFCLYTDYIKDLRRDAIVRFVDRFYPVWVVAGILVPGLIGWAWYGTWDGFIACAFAGGPIRLFFTLTAAWYVNSAAHLAGRRPFATAIAFEIRGGLALQPTLWGMISRSVRASTRYTPAMACACWRTS